MKINESNMEGSVMKTGRFLVLLALVIGLMAGPWQAPAEAEMMGRVGQMINLRYGGGTWTMVLPDGTSQPFILTATQTFIVTAAYCRFYANTPNTGPYRLYLKAPNQNALWIDNLNVINYPTTGATVWGGGIDRVFDPGLAISVLPTLEVKQLPVPPNDPNSGPVVPGTFYMKATGYIVP
jgi:hypothetical protein